MREQLSSAKGGDALAEPEAVHFAPGPGVTIVSRHAWFNGELTDREAGAPSIASVNFHLGTGVFDGLMAYWNGHRYNIWRAEPHLARFVRGAARLGLAIPWTLDELLSGITDLLCAEPPGTQYVRPIAYRRGPELWVTGDEGRPVDVSIFTVRVGRDSDAPISCHLSPVERISSRSVPAQTKVSGAYVNSFHARKVAEIAGYQDGLMLDREGRVAEASAANFFAIVGDRLVTPALNSDVFPGVTRSVVLEIARAAGLDVAERDIYPSELTTIDGAFLCSTLMEIRGLSRLDGRQLLTHELPVFRRIRDDFRTLTHA